MNKSEIKNLLSNMCCSECKQDFNEQSVNIERSEENLLVLRIKCQNCGKSFGLALLGNVGAKSNNDSPLEFQDCPLPINYDDVLDAHHFINKLEKDWSKYIPDELKNI